MAGYLEHSERSRTHRQPRDRRIDHTTPGFVRPPDPCETCGGAGHIDTSPPAVFEAPWLATDTPCPTCRPEETP